MNTMFGYFCDDILQYRMAFKGHVQHTHNVVLASLRDYHALIYREKTFTFRERPSSILYLVLQLQTSMRDQSNGQL